MNQEEERIPIVKAAMHPETRMRGFSVTVPGHAHVRKGIPCQDASAAMAFDTGRIAVVADGHGGDSYVRSQHGSVFAVEEALRALQWFSANDLMMCLDDPVRMEERVTHLKKALIHKWNLRVEQHAASHPFSEAELKSVSSVSDRKAYAEGRNIHRAYGSTVLAVLMMNGYWVALKLGDGKVVRLHADGRFESVFSEDPELVGTMTHSLCEQTAIDHFHHAHGRDVPAGAVVVTDGVERSFLTEKDLFAFFAHVAGHAAHAATKEVEAGLTDYLPVLSQKGSGDDMSIAGWLPCSDAPSEAVKEVNA